MRSNWLTTASRVRVEVISPSTCTHVSNYIHYHSRLAENYLGDWFNVQINGPLTLERGTQSKSLSTYKVVSISELFFLLVKQRGLVECPLRLPQICERTALETAFPGGSSQTPTAKSHAHVLSSKAFAKEIRQEGRQRNWFCYLHYLDLQYQITRLHSHPSHSSSSEISTCKVSLRGHIRTSTSGAFDASAYVCVAEEIGSTVGIRVTISGEVALARIAICSVRLRAAEDVVALTVR